MKFLPLCSTTLLTTFTELGNRLSLQKKLVAGIAAASIIYGPATAAEFEELSTYFAKANLVLDPQFVDCVLSGGSESSCFQITVKPEPKTHTPGPWCPETITDAAGSPAQTRSVGSGVAFDGARLDGTAPVADILSNCTLAPFDDCGGHVNLNVGYHYHAATDCLEKAAAFTDHGNAVGLAMDSHLILARLLNDDSVPGNLDKCGGHSTSKLGYHYHADEQGSNQILGCLVAEYGCVSEYPQANCDASASARKGPGGPPNFAAAAIKLGISEDALKGALGAPPPDFEKAAKVLGISASTLQEALGQP